MSIATLTDDSPVDPDDELLVAYLDGELDTITRNGLEERLLSDARLRSRLQRLQASWEWLDELPEPQPNEKSVETTLAFVVSELNTKNRPQQTFWSRNRWNLTLGALCLVAVIAVVIAFGLRRNREYQGQLADVAIAENLLAYMRGADLKLMRQLSANPDWNQTITTAAKVGELHLGPRSLLSDIPPSKRADAIPKLSVDDRTRLSNLWDQFAGLDKNKQDELRRTAAAVDAQPDAKMLLETMTVFAVWQETLPAKIRDAISSSDPSVRDDAILSAIALTQREVTSRSGSLLDDETIERIYFVLQQILRKRFALLDDETRERLQLFQSRFDPQQAERFSLYGMLSGNEYGRDGRWSPGPPGGIENSMRRPLSDDELSMIEVMLPPAAINDLEKLSGGVRYLQTVTLYAWAEEAVRRKSLAARGATPSLLERYQDFDPTERELLDLLPPERMIDRLVPEERRSPFFSRRGGPSR